VMWAVYGKQTEKLEADDVDSCDQRVWHRQLSRQPLTEKLTLRIIAFLQQCGNVTWSNDALQMAAMTGLMISLDCLISHVGAGGVASEFEVTRLGPYLSMKMDSCSGAGPYRCQLVCCRVTVTNVACGWTEAICWCQYRPSVCFV